MNLTDLSPTSPNVDPNSPTSPQESATLTPSKEVGNNDLKIAS